MGNQKEILIPDLSGFRSGTSRLKGLRLIHTHLNGEPLSRDDLVDLALLRLDSLPPFLWRKTASLEKSTGPT